MSHLAHAVTFQKVTFSWVLLQIQGQCLSENNPNYHAIHHITQEVLVYYHQSGYNKGRFYIVRLVGRLVKFKATRVKGKLTSLRVFRGNTCFCSGLSLK